MSIQPELAQAIAPGQPYSTQSYPIVVNMGPLMIFGGDEVENLHVTQAISLAMLGGGDDILSAQSTVDMLSSGDGNDTIYIHGLADIVDLGAGDDTFLADMDVQHLDAGSGNDVVELNWKSGALDLGEGDDLLVLNKFADSIDGDDGHDVVDFGARDAGAFDIIAVGDSVIVQDRFKGENATITAVEEFIFQDRSFTVEEISEQYAYNNPDPVVLVSDGTQQVTVNDFDPTISVVWDRVVQQAVIDTDAVDVGPTVAARAYAMMHTAMYDAWAAYDKTAARVSLDGEDGDNVAFDMLAELMASPEAKEKAMSYAALTVLQALFPDQAGLYENVMVKRLGYSMEPDGTLPALIGVDAAEDLLALRDEDGAHQLSGYSAEDFDYTPINLSPEEIEDITKWTPEAVPIDSDNPLQSFLTPHWGEVEPFALAELDDGETDHEDHRPPPPEPFFTEAYADAELDIENKQIILGDEVLDVSKDLIGEVINPGFIEQAEHLVEVSANLTDEEKVIAEFAEDGIGTSFPPGTFMTFAQYVSARDNHDLDTDAQLFMAMSNAMHDAAVASWDAKVHYDYARPVRAVRDLGELGLIGEYDAQLGGYAIEAYAGPGMGTQKILATDFVTFQRSTTDPSPPFAEYTSGHSAFSAAGAEVLKQFTGSDDFGASVTFEAGSTQFEQGVPDEDITLYWNTFSDAADMNGQSRIFGGIHFTDGDVEGRALGRQVGEQAYSLAARFFDGSADDSDRPFHSSELFDLG